MSIEQADSSFPTVGRVPHAQRSRLSAVYARVTAFPELLVVLAVAGVLNLWNLSINGTANSYYAAAVKSMASSWHDFLYNSMDKAGLMTVDKPPLSDWIQALSVRVFGYSSWSMLVPQALMGVVAAGFAYDIVRRRFGRVGGFVAGFALATTPTIVAVSRHNNPDELLVMLSVLAMWFALRAIETGKTKWIVWSGVMVGLGFETKMGVALMIVPGIALAYLWMRWTPGSDLRTRVRGNLRMVGQLAWGGLALAVVGLAWPVLVTLTPAADRPWISGTADNSVWSLIFSYNGVGRIAGQSGGPSGGGGFGGGAGSMFGGGTGVLRLLGSSLGSQAGWLLGFAVVSAVALVVTSRLRRRDARTGFVLMIGITLAVISVVFSFASGIFHPYYVSMVAPWAALLIGAGVGEMLIAPLGVAGSPRSARLVGAAAVLGGAVTELVVISNTSDVPGWATPVAIFAGLVGLSLLIVQLSKRVRVALVATALASLFATPVVWASETLGHATSGTFPTGGPASAESGFGGMGGHRGSFGGRSGFGSGSGSGGGLGGGSSSSGGGSMGAGSSSGGSSGGSSSSGSGVGSAPSASGSSSSGSSSQSGSSSSGSSSQSGSSSGAVSQLFNSGSSSSSNSSSGAGSSNGGAPSGSGSAPSGTSGGSLPGGSSGAGSGSGGSSSSGFGGGPGGSSSGSAGFGGGSRGGFGGGGMGGAGGSSSLEAAARYAEEHGGGTVAVESQSTAAEAILAGYTNVAGIGGFSGNESTVSAQWIAKMVSEGRLRYILGGSADSVSSPSDGRTGSASAIKIAESVAKKITVKVNGQTIVLYDLQGKAAAILAAAAKA